MSAKVVIPALLLWNTAFGATLVWDPNSESDLAGYKMYSGTNSRDYASAIDLGNTTQYPLTNLVQGTTYFFAATAYNTSGVESDFSEEISYTAGVSNSPPVISSIADTNVSAGGSLTIPVQVADAQTSADELTLSGTSSNPTLVPNQNITFAGSGSNRTVRVTPAANQTGTATVNITVSDGQLAAAESFVLTVNPANTAPRISSLSDRNIQEDASTGPISFTVHDAETPNALLLSASASNTVLIPNGNIVLGGSGTNRSLTVTPAVNRHGTATITVTVSDGQLASSTSFVLTVTAVNDPPTISAIPDRTINQNTSTGPLPFVIGDVETANGTLTLSGTSSNPALVPNQNIIFGGSGSNRTVSVTPAANQTGTATVSVAVNDGQLAATESFILTVEPANTAPTVSSLSDRTIQEDASTGPISFTVHDAETPNALLLSASASNAALIPNGNIVLGGSGTNRTLTVTPAVNQYGTATITVNVSDGELSGSASFVLTVTAVNDAPTISAIANRTINQNSSTGPLPFVIGDVETDSGNLTLSGTSSNPTLVPNQNITFGGGGSNRTVSVTPAANQSGTATIRIAVSDGTSSASNTWTLTVAANNTNTLPLLSTVRSTTIFSGGSSLPLRFSVSDAQTPTEELLVWAVSSNPALIANSNIVFEGSGTNRTLRVTAANEVGNATITLSVDDGSGGTRSTTFRVNVVARPMELIYLPFEAEEGGIVAPMRLYTNSSTVYVASTSVNQGTLSFQFSVDQPGNYIVWARHLSPNSGQDSFYVSMDGVEIDYSTAIGTWSTNWQWTRVTAPGSGGTQDPRVFNLSASTHTLVFRGREANCGLDQIIICNDLEFIPQDNVNLAASLYSSESVTTGSESSSTQLQVVWESIPGFTYKVQGRRGQSDVWKDLSGPFVATDFQSSWIDPDPANTWQEYRVILVE